MAKPNLRVVGTTNLTATQRSGLDWARDELTRAFALVTAAHELIRTSEHADKLGTPLKLLEIAEDVISDRRWMKRIDGTEEQEVGNA